MSDQEVVRLRGLVVDLAFAVRLFMGLDRTFSTAPDRYLDEMIAEAGQTAQMAAAVKAARAALARVRS